MSETQEPPISPRPEFEPSDLTQDELAEAIRLLFGENGSRSLAAALGERHPLGPRSFDSSNVRKWLSGARPAPLWARDAIEDMLILDAREKSEAAARALALLQRLSGRAG
jgi:hypothetical protein